MLTACLSLVILVALGCLRRPGRIAPLDGKELDRIKRFSERQHMSETVPYE